MEMMKMSYNDILLMPVLRFYDLIKWKNDLEEERTKQIKEQEAKMAANAKVNKRK
jgi:hypothetical protein